jgi:predicted RNA-binding protein YlqC (UPF0109 family)
MVLPDKPDPMSKRIHKLASSLREIGEIEVTETDFMELMHKDIRDLEITRSLRKLGNCKVMEWDFRDVLPAVNKLAQQEVDIAGFLKRTAHYKVMEWDFRNMLPAKTGKQQPDPAEMQALILRLRNFLQFTAVNLIDGPDHAQIKVSEIAPAVLDFRLVMMKRDVAMLIGTGGHTAAAIRGIMKAAAARHGVQVLLRIHSHEEETAMAFNPKTSD